MTSRQVPARWGWLRRSALLVPIPVVFVALLAVFAQTPTFAASSPGDWPSYRMGDGTGFNGSENLITPFTASRLKLHWTAKAASVVSAQAVVTNNMVYWGDWFGNERATSLTGGTVWSTNLGRTLNSPCAFDYLTQPGITSTATVTTVNGRSMLFVGGGDAQVYALDALTGAILWRTRLGASPQSFIWGSPAVYTVSAGATSVYIGLASYGDCPVVQGKFVQLDAVTGTIQHSFSVVPNGCIGGGVWGSPTFDTATGTVYITTGNSGSCSSAEPKAVAVVQLQASDLTQMSYWQVPPTQQVWDGDFGTSPTLFTATINGVPTAMVGVVNKNGIYYAFNRAKIAAGPVWQRTISAGGDDPSTGNATITPAAWDGQTLYVGSENTVINGVACSGSLRALDPATGAFLWQNCMSDGHVFGAVSAVRGLAVVGEGAWINMVSTSSGNTVYRFHNPSGQMFYTPATISHGVLYQASTDGTLFAIGL